MKTTALFITLIFMGAPFASNPAEAKRDLSCYDGARNPLATEEMEQFDFLIGSFNATIYPWDAEAGDWSTEPFAEALWEGEYILDGTAIADYWYDKDPAKFPDTNRGVNTRIYNSETSEWNMNWNTWGTKPATTVLKAKVIDGVMTMWQVFPEVEQKWVSDFVIDTQDHWTRFTYIAQGDNRIPIFKIESYRIPCGDQAG